MAKSKRQPEESVSGRYTPIPHNVLDSVAFMGASCTAKSLLLELVRQHNGANNGRFQLTKTWLEKRGWRSPEVIIRARRQLIDRGLVIQTRQGGLNQGPSQFGVTWLAITNFLGLDISSREYHPGAWHFMDKLPMLKNSPPHATSSHVTRSNSVEADKSGEHSITTPIVTKSALFVGSVTRPDINAKCYQLPTAKNSRPIIGKKGRSGKRAIVV